MTQIPSVMRAVVLTGHGDMDKLEYHDDWPTPKPSACDVLIQVGACGLNNTDVNSRTAWYSKGVSEATTGETFETAESDDASWGGAAIQFPRIQGADICGRVRAIGERVPKTLLNQRVMVETWIRDWSDPDNLNKCGYLGSECDGGFADYLTVDYRQVHTIQSDLTDIEIATFATSWLTAENMLNQAQVNSEDTVLITGASGGVGSALIQLANRRGATTIGMASDSKHDRLKQFSPDALIGRAPDQLKSELRNVIGSESVTVVLDVVGGDYWPNLLSVLSRNGRYVCSGAIAGPIVHFDLRTMYLNDLKFFGCTVVPRGTFANLVNYIQNGEVSPIVAAVYPLKKLKNAQQALINKKHIGNIVISLDSHPDGESE